MTSTTTITNNDIITQGLAGFQRYLSSADLDAKPHQTAGVRWMLTNEHIGHNVGGKVVKGGLLADEMGLGKTIQALGIIVSNFKSSPGTLIVLPLALMDQWENVCIRTLGHAPLIYHGTNKNDITKENLEQAPIVITTYGHITPAKNCPDTFLHSVEWSRVIFDEAHHLRNNKTKTFLGAMKLKADIRWMVTGTPIQNRMSDFYSLCAQIGLPESYYTAPDNMNELVQNFVLRRTKAEVGLQLPELRSHTIHVPWTNTAEKKLAEQIHSLLQFSHVSVDEVDMAVAAMNAESVLPMLIRARQACIFPHLIAKHVQKLIRLGVLEDTPNILEATKHSSKIDRLIDIITERSLTESQKARAKLVFCHYRGEIDIIAERLKATGMNVKTFDGRTPMANRDNILGGDCDVLVLQIQTGCEGLNLQHFKEVYFVSPHWNPAVEDQAVARCHRIGQREEIDVFRFSMQSFDDERYTNTLDEYSSNVQTTKRRVMTEIETTVENGAEP